MSVVAPTVQRLGNSHKKKAEHLCRTAVCGEKELLGGGLPGAANHKSALSDAVAACTLLTALFVVSVLLFMYICFSVFMSAPSAHIGQKLAS